MVRSIPHVEGGRLYQTGQRPPIDVGTRAWFGWLERHAQFTFADAAGDFTAYKRPPFAVDSPWSAVPTRNGLRERLELGPSSALTLTRLQATARLLADRPPAAVPRTAHRDVVTPAVPASTAPLLPEPGEYSAPASVAYQLEVQQARPRLPGDVIARPRLLARLDAGLSSSLTLVRGPAGSGKTTLLVQWLATLAHPVAYLSLTPAESDLPRFVQALASALQRAVPGAFPATARLPRAPRFPPLTEVLALLLDELADLPEPVVVVLDDYHHIANSSEVHALIAGLVEHSSAQWHLVLAKRTRPPLPLARWRARGQLAELDSADLRLTRKEAAAFLERLWGEPPDVEVTAALLALTQGWPALVRLAALSLRAAPDRAVFLARLAEVPERAVSDYLVEEVLATFAPGELSLLAGLSLLEDFNAELAAAVLGQEVTVEQVQQRLEALERSGLLVLPIPEQPGWYRLHPLLARVLQQHVLAGRSPEEIAGLHRRARAWYAGQGRLDEALQEALAGGDAPEAARLVEAQFLPAFEHERWRQMERWLGLLPQEQIERSPSLLLARAWMAQAQGQLTKFPPLLSQAGRILAEREEKMGEEQEHRALHALIAIGWSHFQYFTGQFQASLESARSALAWSQPAEALLASYAVLYIAWSLQATGQEEEALAQVQQALVAAPGEPTTTARLLYGQAFVSLAAGKLLLVEQTARHLLRLAQMNGLVPSQQWAHRLLGVVAYERNELETAAYHFSAVIANLHQALFWAVEDALCGLALAYHAQGRDNEARQTRDALLDWVQDQHNLPQLLMAYAFAGRLALLEGKLQEASDFLELAGEQRVAGPMPFLEDPPITQAWLLLESSDAESRTQGQALLTQLMHHVEAMHNTPKTMRVLALQARACELQDQRPQALDALERALELGRPVGFVRTFADLPGLAPLLHELRGRHQADRTADKQRHAYLERILAAMRPVAAPAGSTQDLLRREGLEPLTGRELDILRLLERDLTNKEIARELVITPGTVKAHTTNLYRKLGVEHRRAAVALARSLGLLAAEESGQQDQ